MNTRKFKPVIWIIFITVILLWSQCKPSLDSVDHPIEVRPMDTISIPVTISCGWDPGLFPTIGIYSDLIKNMAKQMRHGNDTAGNYIWFGMEMPDEWVVLDSFIYVAYDSLPATIIDSGLFAYSDFHVDLLNEWFSTPPGYKWMAWQTTDTMLMEKGKMWFDPKLVTAEQIGYYHLAYISGWNDSIAETDFQKPMLTICGEGKDTSWVTTTSDSGAGSLRYAIYNTKSGGDISFALDVTDTIILDSEINIYRPVNINKYPGAGHLINIQGPLGQNALSFNISDGFDWTPHDANINQVNIFNSGGAGIFAFNTPTISIQNSFMHHNLGAGIKIIYDNLDDEEDSYVQIYRCDVFNNQASGMHLEGGKINIGQSHIYNNLAQLGGGILAKRCELSLYWDTFIIENNSAESGGGIYFDGSGSNYYLPSLSLSDIIIRNNEAETGGGIYAKGIALETDNSSDQLPSIYLNQANSGSDIYYDVEDPFIINLDTFSVLHPTNDYLIARHSSSLTSYTYHINNGMVEQFNQDLFVSPEGNDENDGLTWQTAKKTIKATTRICDPAQPLTIYLDSGYFSTDQNGDIYPIYMEPNITLKGKGADITYLGTVPTVFEILHDQAVHINDMTILGYDKAIICNNAGLYLDHVDLENDHSPGTGQAIDGHFNDIVLKNCTLKSYSIGIWSNGFLRADSCIFIDNDQAAIINIGASGHDTKIPSISNTIFIRNGRGVTQCDRLIAYNIVGENNGVAISVDEHLEISHSYFTGNKSGIWFEGDTLIVDSCKFIANDAYKGDPFSYGYTKGAGIFMGYSSGGPESIFFRLNNSYFGENTAENGAAFCFGIKSNLGSINKHTDLKITNCIFENNYLYPDNGDGSAICFSLESLNDLSISLDITNSLFTDNFDSKSAIYAGRNCNVTLINTTLVNNETQYGIYTSTNDSLNIINSILRHSADDAIYQTNIPPQISYTNIQGGWEGIGNIDSDPMFDSLGVNPYQLMNESPCVNAGSPDTNNLGIPLYDLGGNYRITGDRIDMGAYECLFTGILHFPQMINTFEIIPNPARDYIKCQFIIDKRCRVVFTLFDQQGKELRFTDRGFFNSGSGIVKIDIRDLNTGIYYIRIQAGQEMVTRKIVKL